MRILSEETDKHEFLSSMGNALHTVTTVKSSIAPPPGVMSSPVSEQRKAHRAGEAAPYRIATPSSGLSRFLPLNGSHGDGGLRHRYEPT